MLLLIDNYDSFTYNLYQYLAALYPGVVTVKRNDVVTVEDAAEATHIVISPGPGNPTVDSDFGRCGDIIQELHREIPILGVCLGHQGIGHFFGAPVGHASRVMHGKVSKIHHSGTGLFSEIPQGIQVGRYHSLSISDPPQELEVTAVSDDGEIMSVRHRIFPTYGVQFHPESILTEYGREILMNFIAITS